MKPARYFEVEEMRAGYNKDTEVKIKFCWGKHKCDSAVVFLNAFKKGVQENDLAAIATAFNVPVLDADALSQHVALLQLLWHWDELRDAEWIDEVMENAQEDI